MEIISRHVKWARKNKEMVKAKQFPGQIIPPKTVCVICGSTPKARKNGAGDNFDLDHNHKTGEIRGYLCRGCNLMIGLLEREGVDLLKVVDYLEKSE